MGQLETERANMTTGGCFLKFPVKLLFLSLQPIPKDLYLHLSLPIELISQSNAENQLTPCKQEIL